MWVANCLPVYLPIYLSVWLSVQAFAVLTVLPDYLAIWPSIYLSGDLARWLCVPIALSVCLSVCMLALPCLAVHFSSYLAICLSGFATTVPC